MKRRLCLFLLSLSLLTGCATGAAYPAVPEPEPPQSTPAAVPLEASQPQAQLTVIVENCDNVRIVESAVGSCALSSPTQRYSMTMSQPVHGVTTATIRQTPGLERETTTLTVPRGNYDTIRVEAKESGLQLSPDSANYQVAGSDLAFDATLLSSY